MPMFFYNFLAASRKSNLKPFGIFQDGSDINWIASADPGDFVLVSLIGTMDGVNATFVLPSLVKRLVMIFKQGLTLYEGVHFNRDHSTITFLPGNIPQPGNLIRALIW
jgi:hypothetical protein